MSRPHRGATHVLLVAAFLTGAGCSASAPRADTSTQGSLIDEDGNDAGLPNLAQGLHLGFTSFVDVDDPAGVDELTTTALAAGMDIGRVWLDWVEVERDAGQVGLDELRQQLAELKGRGQAPMVGLLALDGDTYTLPADLSDRSDDSKIATGSSLSDPRVIERYLALVDKILPDLVDSGVWALTVMNEPDTLLGDVPAPENLLLANSMVAFMTAVRDHVHAVAPGIAVNATISPISIHSPPANVERIIESGDILSANFGCLDFDTFLATDPASIPADLDSLERLAGGRAIVIQELSCASGFSEGSSIESTITAQADWLDTVYSALGHRPQFRAAFVLDLVDWPESLYTLFSDFLREEGLDDIADKWGEFMGSWGLVTFDLEPKPAWDVFLDALARSSEPDG